MSLPRYGNYKVSGIDWLPEIPAHWDVCALKRIASLQSGETITAEKIENAGTYPVYGGNGLRGFTTAYTHEGRFALIGRQGALCGNVNYSQGKFWASEHAVVVTPLKSVNTTWLGEMLRAMNLNQYSVSAAQPGLSVELISRIAVPYPPLDEQTAIAAFLDRETTKIDALIAEQKKLIALLVEKRQATISHAVTKGLNPDALMNDSGVAWLGEMPAHWEVRRLKTISPEITVGIVVEPSKYYVDDGVPALRSLNVFPGQISTNNLVYISAKSNETLAKSRLRAGDLVSVRSGQTGVTAVVPEHLDGCNCIDLIIIRKPLNNCGRFLCWFFASDSALRQFASGSGGAIQQHFNIGTAMNLQIPLPSLDEQHAITVFLEDETRKLDVLCSEAERAITLLQERRSALVTAAVTGQIDLCSVIFEPMSERQEAIAA